MYSSLTRRKRSLVERLFVDKSGSYNMFEQSRRYSLSFYIKCIICILILYYLNILIGFKSYIWFEKSFQDEYHLTMTHIDVVKAELNPIEVLGQPINILSNQFLIENPYLCGRSSDPETRLYPHLIILVKSFTKNFKERQSIRLTWGQNKYLTKNDIKLAFVIGTSPDNINIKDESKKYGDIIQIDKLDYYYYSSYKMIMMLRWINDFCSAQTSRTTYLNLKNYVLFVNEDYYLDIDSLLLYINMINSDPDMTTYERRTFITGELIEKSRPKRFLNDRWYVSLIDYPYDIYPSYISTECFLMTIYNARLFYLASQYVRLFHFEQIYLGLLSYSMSTNLIENNQLFSTSLTIKYNQTQILSKWKTIFNKKSNFNSTIKSICYRGYKNEKLIDLWNQIHQTNITLTFD